MSDAATVRDASYPFSPLSDPENPPDVILRSSDLVDFHVHKALLAFGSLVFRNMFSFPAPTSAEGDAMKGGKPIVPLTESSETLEKLLILCYPRLSGDGFHDLDGVDGAYEAAHKYQLSGGQKQLEKVLVEPRFLEKHPHRVFAIACHHGLEDIAKAAALETLKLPRYVPDLSAPELKFISGLQLRQLEDFHFHCSKAMAELVSKLADADWDEYWCDDDDDEAMANGKYTEVWWSKEGHSAMCGPTFTGEYDLITPARWFGVHISTVESAVHLSPHFASASKKMTEIVGEALNALSECPTCMRSALYGLSQSAMSVECDARRAYQDILAKISFTG
ncbi:hypothetical protein C8R45DRAFT_881520 [Mycena sanguinolenta]|nr:hypothetical protein C8R45DRAFT_881520 [Mycena sanguinolenta]